MLSQPADVPAAPTPPTGLARSADVPHGRWARFWWHMRGRPLLRCAFCSASRVDVRFLVAGDRAAICSGCVARCMHVLPVLEDPVDMELYCQFCNRERPAVPHLVGSPGRYLCRACVDKCAGQLTALEVASEDEQLSLPGLGK